MENLVDGHNFQVQINLQTFSACSRIRNEKSSSIYSHSRCGALTLGKFKLTVNLNHSISAARHRDLAGDVHDFNIESGKSQKRSTTCAFSHGPGEVRQ